MLLAPLGAAAAPSHHEPRLQGSDGRDEAGIGFPVGNQPRCCTF